MKSPRQMLALAWRHLERPKGSGGQESNCWVESADSVDGRSQGQSSGSLAAFRLCPQQKVSRELMRSLGFKATDNLRCSEPSLILSSLFISLSDSVFDMKKNVLQRLDSCWHLLFFCQEIAELGSEFLREACFAAIKAGRGVK